MDHGAMIVTSEREFITAMIPHHEEAVASAKMMLASNDRNPAVKDISTTIISTQEKEIATMKQWYKDWYGIEYTGAATYIPMMRDLSTLSGDARNEAFLKDMILHHQGAITMARSATPYVEHDEVRVLIENIITTQTAEIARMEQIISASD
jgi:uncharacterized protein (DUF305 family)